MCTGIKLDYKDGCVMGRTMDFEAPLNYNVVYLPDNYHYGDDLMGQPLYSKYKAMGISFSNRDPLKDGVNEHGLIGITNDFFGFNLYKNKIDPDKINLSSLDYLNYALMNYKSVDELVDDLENIHMSTRDHKGSKVIAPDFHFMFADSTKRCVVVEPIKGEIEVYDNPYDVMTNSPGFKSHVRRLDKYFDLDQLEDFNSSKDLPGGYDPVSRFIKAFYLTRTNVEVHNYKEALACTYDILSAMNLPNGFIKNKKYDYNTFTRYICAYDSENKLLTVRSNTNPTVYELGFDDIKDKSKRQGFFLDLEFTTKKIMD